jgi:hypothetical protein
LELRSPLEVSVVILLLPRSVAPDVLARDSSFIFLNATVLGPLGSWVPIIPHLQIQVFVAERPLERKEFQRTS